MINLEEFHIKVSKTGTFHLYKPRNVSTKMIPRMSWIQITTCNWSKNNAFGFLYLILFNVQNEVHHHLCWWDHLYGVQGWLGVIRPIIEKSYFIYKNLFKLIFQKKIIIMIIGTWYAPCTAKYYCGNRKNSQSTISYGYSECFNEVIWFVVFVKKKSNLFRIYRLNNKQIAAGPS